MTTLREAAELALDAMTKASGWMSDADYRQLNASITALRAALAEPVQEPVMHSRDALDAAAAAEREACARVSCGA